MSGFAAWVDGPPGTSVLAGCALVVGVILGYLTGRKIGWRAAELELAERRALRAQARWLERVRGEWDGTRGGTVMPHRPQLEVVHEWEPAHVASTLALANDDPSVTAWTQAMAAGMDAWLAEHVYGVPYSADELWSGQ